MNVDWTPLRQVLSRFRDHDVPLPIWWRDDDAVEPTRALDQLEALSSRLALPVHLAVIPRSAKTSLADRISDVDLIHVLAHGWAHANHAPTGEKKSEFGQLRDGADQEFVKARTQIESLFGQKALPVFVPPWNRFDFEYLSALSASGFLCISTFAPRKMSQPHPRVLQVNCHVDPIDWRGTRGLPDPRAIIDHTAAQLNARLDGQADSEEPFGYLTHHLVHTPDIWEFSYAFLTECLDGGATPRSLPQLLEVSE